MDKSVTRVLQWLNSNKNHLLKIKKEEDQDLDLTELTLKDVNLVNHQDHDHYLSAQALLLNGEGNITTAYGKSALPYDVFEIPLTDQWSVSTTDHGMRLHTERGIYTIEVAD